MTNILKRNNVKVIGEGEKVMIFAHGYGCDQNVWRLITWAFAQDYKLILFDYVGSGKSDIAAYDDHRYSTLKGYTQDLIEICQELKISDAIFIGHSVSGMIGILASIEHPELFSKMVFLSPSPKYINDHDYEGGFDKKDLDELLEVMDSNYLGWSKSLALVIMKNADRPELGDELANSFCATDPDIAKKFARVTFLSDNREDLKNFKIPSLTLQCLDDIIAPLAVGNYIHEQVKNNKLVILKATGHCSHMSAPNETIAAIKDFIS